MPLVLGAFSIDQHVFLTVVPKTWRHEVEDRQRDRRAEDWVLSY